MYIPGMKSSAQVKDLTTFKGSFSVVISSAVATIDLIIMHSKDLNIHDE